MADIVLKDRNGNDVTYSGIETVTFDTPTEGEQVVFTEGVKAEKSLALDMSEGDVEITPEDGTLLSKVTIAKPETMTAENIRSGVDIGGVTGEFIGDTEEQTVELAMADGDMTIEPSEVGKVLSKVLIQKPETLIPENIAEGIDIAGVIGTFAGSDPPKFFKKNFTASADTYTGIVTLATAEELETIGFAEGSRKFMALISSTTDQVNSVTSFYTLICNLVTSWSMTCDGTASRNCVIVKNIKSGTYTTTASVELLYKAAFSGSTMVNSIFYQDGEIRFDADNSTYHLKNAASTYIPYYLVAGVLS